MCKLNETIEEATDNALPGYEVQSIASIHSSDRVVTLRG